MQYQKRILDDKVYQLRIASRHLSSINAANLSASLQGNLFFICYYKELLTSTQISLIAYVTIV